MTLYLYYFKNAESQEPKTGPKMLSKLYYPKVATSEKATPSFHLFG